MKPDNIDKYSVLVGHLATIEERLNDQDKRFLELTEKHNTLVESVMKGNSPTPATTTPEPKAVDPVLQTYIENGYTPEYDSEGNWTGRVSYRSESTETNEPTPKTDDSGSDVQEAVLSAMKVGTNLTKGGVLNSKAIESLIEKFGGTRARFWSISNVIKNGQ